VIVSDPDGGQRGLGGGDAGDRHPEGRAADVVQAGHVEERDRVGVAAVLAADAELEVRARLAADPGGEAHEPADAGAVDRLEGRAVEDPGFEVVREEAGFDVVAREAERRLGEVVGAEGEEVGDVGDAVGDEAGARELDHRPDQRGEV
jgi:hypothetical protein